MSDDFPNGPESADAASETPTPAAKPPKGTRFKGTYRTAVGWILAVLWPFGLIRAISDKEPIGSLIMTMLVWAVLAAALIVWGRSLKAQHVVVVPKALQPTPSGRGANDLQALIARDGDRGRISLYVMDKHRNAVKKLASLAPDYKPGPLGGNGALVAWADIIPEPKNTYDSEAIQAHVMGRPVGYFSLIWKSRAHEQLRTNRPRGAQVPVVIRWWNGRAFVWAFSSFEDAQSFAKWAMNDAES